ncbi:MAG TPA: hypothetical protein VIM77_01295, partial [Mucilaginibacter sp.]
VKIPVNTTASLTLPNADATQVKLDGKPLTGATAEKDGVTVQLGSGEYAFSYPWAVVNESVKAR